MTSESEMDAVVGQALVAQEIRRYRERAGLSLNTLALRVGYSRTYISASEKPGTSLISANVVKRIDDELGAGGALIELRARVHADHLARRIQIQAEPVERGTNASSAIVRPANHVDRHTVEADPMCESESELVTFYPHRNAVPNDLWDHLITQATTKIDVLVYVGMFLTEKPGLLATLRAKAEHRVKIRLLFGQRDSPAVIQRSTDEGIGAGTISAKIDHSIAHFGRLADVSGVEIRTHDTVLYNSIYQFDDDMITNPHVFGKTAPHAPAIHLRRHPTGSLFATYEESYEDVWARSRRLEPDGG